MPIYEYECEDCGQVEEAWQKFSDAPLSQCKHCSGSLHKLISQSAFHLKGSGWYVTDYNKKPAGEGKPAESKADASSSGGAKSDTGSSASSGSSGTSDSAS
jgi:putative FmdB family regulatory protein